MRILLSLVIVLLLSSFGTSHAQRGRLADDEAARWERVWAEQRATEARNHARLAEAKRRFLSGDEDGARAKLTECEWVAHGFYCMSGPLWDEMQFFSWELDAHRFDRALERFHSLSARYGDTTRHLLSQRMARVYTDAGITPPPELDLPDLSASTLR